MTLEKALAQTIQAFKDLETIGPAIDEASRLILGSLRGGGRLLACGNGGSAAEAAHLTTELIGRYELNRRSLPAISLSSDGSVISCIGNDFGYEQVFSRQIAGLAKPGDLVVAFSSSGNSPNILAALREAAARGLPSLAFLGRGGGKARGLATCELIVPGDSGAAAQEAHLFLIHHFCRQIDAAFA